MGWDLDIASVGLLLHENRLPMTFIGSSGDEHRHGKHRHYLPGMSPPFKKQLRFLIFVFMMVVPSQKNSAKPLPAFNHYKIVLSARAPFFGGVAMPIFATGYQMR